MIAPLPEVVVGLLLLIVLFALGLLLTALAQPLRASSFPGASALGDLILNGQAGIQNAMAATIENGLGSLIATWDRLSGGWSRLLAGQLGLLGALAAALERVFWVSIPNAINLAWGFAHDAYLQAATQASSALAAVEAGLQAAQAGLSTALDNLGSELRQRVTQAVAAAAVYAEHLVATEASRVGQLVAQAESEAAQALALEAQAAQAAERELGRELGQVAAQANTDLQAAERSLGYELGQVAVGLESELAAARRELVAEVVDFEALVGQEIERVLASTPWAALVAGVEGGESLLRQDLEALVVLGARAVRRQLGDTEALRARYGPELRRAYKRIQAQVEA